MARKPNIEITIRIDISKNKGQLYGWRSSHRSPTSDRSDFPTPLTNLGFHQEMIANPTFAGLQYAT